MMENSIGSQDQGLGAVIDDPDQQACADEAATLSATLDGGAASSSWYWTSMLNFSQSGSSSTHTSAGQMAPSHMSAPAASPPSSSSVHINQHVDQPPPSFDNILASHNANTNTLSNDPEQSVWSQEFLSGPIGESKPSIHTCTDDGLQELLFPRTVRELLFSDQLKLDQSPSWDLLQQAAAMNNKSFGFPLGPDDPMQSLAPAQLHCVPPDIKPGQLLHYSHDDRLSSSTASSTLSDNTQQLAEQWAAPSPAAQPPCEHAQPRTCPMHVPHTTLLQQQFDHARVKQEYTTANNPPPTTNTLTAFNSTNTLNYGKSQMNPFLLQHQQQQHNLRLINPNHDQASLLNDALLNVDVKPSKLASWPPSPAAVQLCRSASSFDLAGLSSSVAATDHHHHTQLVNPIKQHNLHDINPGFCNPSLPLITQDPSLFQPEHLLQQAMAHHHHGGLLNTTPFQYLNNPNLPVGLKKSRAHIEVGQGGGGATPTSEEGKEKSGSDQKVGNILHDKQQLCEDFNFKRPRVDHNQQQQQHQTPSTSSFKSQPVRKEKLGERITTLQQLVSPFGKTDTASVLLEAIGYIKFLQDQVQSLSSPYLKSVNNTTIIQNGEKNQNGEEAKPDLRSKGLCLVPLSCTMQVANDNGADYWYGGAFR